MNEVVVKLVKDSVVVVFVLDVFVYLKVIGVIEGVKVLMDCVGVELDEGVIDLVGLFEVVKLCYWDCELKVCDLV